MLIPKGINTFLLFYFVTAQVVNLIKENLKNCVIYGEKYETILSFLFEIKVAE